VVSLEAVPSGAAMASGFSSVGLQWQNTTGM
jgi:hypothetical protein